MPDYYSKLFEFLVNTIPGVDRATQSVAGAIDQRPSVPRQRIEAPKTAAEIGQMVADIVSGTVTAPYHLAKTAYDAAPAFVEQPVASARGFAAGAVEGAGQLLTPLNLAMALAGMGAKRYAGITDSAVQPISKDLYGLSEAPIDRRNFLWRAAQGPQRAAKARVSAVPETIDKIAETLNATPKYDIANRSRALDVVRNEADLVSALQEKYGILNDNLFVDPVGPNGELARFNFLEEYPKSADRISGAVSSSTNRKLSDRLDVLRDVQPTKVSWTSRKNRAEIEKLGDPRDNPTTIRLDKALERARGALDRLIDSHGGSQNIPWRDPNNRVAIRASQLRKRGDEIFLKRSRFVRGLNEKIFSLENDVQGPVKGDPQGYLDLVLRSHREIVNRALEFDNSPEARSKPKYWKTSRSSYVVPWANEQLRKSVARIGGPLGKVARDLAEAQIEGRQVVSDLADSLVSKVLEDRFGIKPEVTKAVKGVTDAAYKTAGEVADAPNKIMGDVSKDIMKRLGMASKARRAKK